ncbi:MAG: fatty acid desaturase [Verrucomicrobia bacterium]|nr:fatty acid desaturase [Verrucomicrobiota bacterium]
MTGPIALEDFRDILREYSTPRLLFPLAIFAVDLVLYGAAIAGVMLLPYFAARLACSLAAGFLTGLIFVVGHDACHGSFTRFRWLNQFIGRVAFLPSLHSFSMWNYNHNRVHHGSTNYRVVDYAWAPLTKGEFDALPWWKKLVARAYRSGPGHGLYYGVELWWKRTVLPLRRDLAPARNWKSWLDGALVIGFFVAAFTVLAWFAPRIGRHPVELPVLALVLPFAVWNWFMGFITYQHHTHPAVAWFAREEEWSYWETQIGATVHIRFPRFINLAAHNILEHTAHHACTGIPLYRLNSAQNALERRLVDRFPVVRWTLRGYFDTLRRCKLYDYERHVWLDFKGRPTSPPTVHGRSVAAGAHAGH